MKLLIATRNPNKLQEFKTLLLDTKFDFLGLDQVKTISKNFNIPETGKTFQKNASLKARGYGQKANLLTLADDSGFMIDHLNGSPGVHSSRFTKGNFNQARKRLLQSIKVVPKSKRTAQFICVLALYNPKFKKIKYFKGITKGKVTQKEQGSSGFGYDSIFLPLGFKKTYAQISQKQKNQISHRAMAFQKLKNYFKIHYYD